MGNLRTSLVLLAALGLLAPAAEAQQQAPPPAAPQKAKEQLKPKAKRVWSEEEVKELRKPWDQVEEEKKEEAKPGAAADAKAAGAEVAKPEGEAAAVDPDAPALPKTIEEADKMLAYKHTEVRAQQELVAELQRELYDESSTASRDDLKQKIEKARLKLRESQDEYKRINTAREELKAKKEGKAPGGEQPPAQQAPPTKPPSR